MRRGGILLLSYEEYVALLNNGAARNTSTEASSPLYFRSYFDRLREPLPDSSSQVAAPNLVEMLSAADILVIDEAHRLRRDTSKFVSLLRLHVPSITLRIALTGTPIQNHLKEYNVMQSVVTGAVINHAKFERLFVQPIESGQCIDSTYQQFTAMQECVAALRRFFALTVHHVGPDVLERELPPRLEVVLFFELTPEQKEMYTKALNAFEKYHNTSSGSGGSSFSSALHFHHVASHIACHPSLCRLPRSWRRKRQRDTPSDMEGDRAEEGKEEEEEADTLFREEEDEDEDDDVDDVGGEEGLGSMDAPTSSSIQIILQHSSKLFFALELVSHIVFHLKEKVVVFSQYKSHLRLVQRLLSASYHLTNAPIFSGDLSDLKREAVMQQFSNETDCHVLLCSKKAGGVGIDLSAANHCILLDVCWNPSDDVQSGYRVYRYGQTRPVTIYRLATEGTTEQVVFAYALQKTWLQRKIADVKDPERQRRHRTQSYFEYPCRTSIRQPRALVELKRAGHLSTEERQQQRGELLLQWCETHCRPAAQVLTTNHTNLLPFLSNAVKHAFLLRDDSNEAVRQISKRFHTRSLTLPSSPLASTTALTTPPALPVGGTPSPPPPTSLADRRTVEKKLLSKAHRAASCCVYGILRDGGAMLRLSTTTTTDISREEASHCAEQLFHLWRSLLPDDRPADHFDDWWLKVYQIGAARLMKEKAWFSPHITCYRSVLQQSLTVEGSRGEATLLHALQFAPHHLLEELSGVSATYFAVELGLPRPIIPQLFFIGLKAVIEETRQKNGGSCEALLSLRCSDEEREEEIIERVLGYLDECWPAFTGFKKPRLPFVLQTEEQLVQRALQRARGGGGHHAGPRRLLDCREVVEALQLQPYKDTDWFACPRCGCVLRTSPEAASHHQSGALHCKNCHFHTGFRLLSDSCYEHHAVVFQLALVVNLLDAFSVSHTFQPGWSALKMGEGGPPSLLAVLRYSEDSRLPVLQVVERSLQQGAEEFCRLYSTELVRSITVECGAEEVSQLPRLLVANGRMLWQKNTRDGIRWRTNEETQKKLPHILQTTPSFPSLLLYISFYNAVKAAQIRYVCELDQSEYLEDSQSHQLLRFMSASVVKIKYIEKALQQLQHHHHMVSTTREGRRETSYDDGVAELLAESFSEDEKESRQGCDDAGVRSDVSEKSPDATEAAASLPLSPLLSPSLHDFSSSTSSSSSSFSSFSSSPSSFGSCYSEDRQSFQSDELAEEEATDKKKSTHHLDPLSPSSTSLRKDSRREREGDSEAHCLPQEMQAACYWAAHCEVYGTHHTRSLRVIVEGANGDDGLLPSPSPMVWGPLLQNNDAAVSVEGMSTEAVLNDFWRHLETLARGVPLL